MTAECLIIVYPNPFCPTGNRVFAFVDWETIIQRDILAHRPYCVPISSGDDHLSILIFIGINQEPQFGLVAYETEPIHST
jgi:hypothetical protein